MTNITKLNETYDFIATLPYCNPNSIEPDGDMWGQWTYGEQYPCGTVACFAGWRCIQDGIPRNEIEFAGDIHCRAAVSFELTGDQASVLFDSSRTLPELRALIDTLTINPDAPTWELHDALVGVGRR